MILKVVSAEVCGAHSLLVTFNDGTKKRVDLLQLLEGPVFIPLREPDYFSRVMVDVAAGTVVWPNGADLARRRYRTFQTRERRRLRDAPSARRVRYPEPKIGAGGQPRTQSRPSAGTWRRPRAWVPGIHRRPRPGGHTCLWSGRPPIR